MKRKWSFLDVQLHRSRHHRIFDDLSVIYILAYSLTTGRIR